MRLDGRTVSLAALLACAWGPALAGEPGARTDLHGDPLPPGALVRLGSVRFAGRPRVLAYSSDGKLLASGTETGTVILFDSKTGKPLRSFGNAKSSLRDLAFSPDGKLLVSAHYGCDIHVWDVATGKSLQAIEADKSSVSKVAFTPDGKTIVSGGREGVVRFWAVSGGKKLREAAIPAAVTAMDLSPDGKLLAAGWGSDEEGGIVVLDAASAKEKVRLGKFKRQVTSLDFSPNGRMLAAGASGSNAVLIWDPASGRRLSRLAAGSAYSTYSVCFSPNSRMLAASGGYRRVHLWNLATGRQVGKLEMYSPLAFSPDGRFLVGGGYGRIRRWNLTTRREMQDMGHSGPVTALGLGPGGQTLVTVGRDETARRWDLKTAKEKVRLKIGRSGYWYGSRSLLSADGRVLVSRGENYYDTHLWDLASGRKFMNLSRAGSPVHLAADGKKLLMRKDRVLSWWDLTTGRSLGKAYQLSKKVYGVGAISPDGRVAACALKTSAGEGSYYIRGIRLVDLAKGRILRTLAPDKSVHERTMTFSPDGKLLAAYHYGMGLVVWGVEDGREVCKLPIRGFMYRLSALAFSTDGKMLACGFNRDGTLRLFRVAGGAKIAKLKGHLREVTALLFSPDGARLFSGGGVGTVLAWDLKGIVKSPPEPEPEAETEPEPEAEPKVPRKPKKPRKPKVDPADPEADPEDPEDF